MAEIKRNDLYLDSDGTLGISADVDISKVKRILLTQEGTHYGSMYYLDDSEQPEERTQKRTETHACVLISRADVEQTVEDNILCYTHSDTPIDQDPDTECHKAIRTALKMLRKDLRKLPSAQQQETLSIEEVAYELGCNNSESAYYWAYFLRKLYDLDFRVVRKNEA